MKKEAFGKVDGKEAYKYTLIGDNVSVDVLDFGATIQSLFVDGINVVQSFDTAEVVVFCTEFEVNNGAFLFVCCHSSSILTPKIEKVGQYSK